MIYQKMLFQYNVMQQAHGIQEIHMIIQAIQNKTLYKTVEVFRFEITHQPNLNSLSWFYSIFSSFLKHREFERLFMLALHYQLTHTSRTDNDTNTHTETSPPFAFQLFTVLTKSNLILIKRLVTIITRYKFPRQLTFLLV